MLLRLLGQLLLAVLMRHNRRLRSNLTGTKHVGRTTAPFMPAHPNLAKIRSACARQRGLKQAWRSRVLPGVIIHA